MSIPINPRLPRNFSNTANEQRPPSHQPWWDRPYIQTYSWEQMKSRNAPEEDRAQWFASWPSGTRYDVRCLDGGAWDRPTCWGMFGTLDEALECAKTGPAHRSPRTQELLRRFR